MKPIDAIKNVAWLIGVVFVIIIGLRIYKSINEPSPTTIIMPKDTSGTPITHETYRPPSIPLVENPVKPKVKLPNNLREKDVDRVITVVKSPHDTVQIVFPKRGEPYVDRKGGEVLSVTITEYLDPILSFGWYVKIGLSGNSSQLSPMIGVSFLRIMGKVDVPVFGLDLDGIGLGLDYRLFEPISIGIMAHNRWQTQKSIRLTLCWNF
jgi:hypothetical protein